jgi:DNA topoisomerase-1
LGNDPVTESPMVLKDGRFGPYVTDGTTNASLRKGDDVESITPERASELLAERRAAGPSKKKKAAKKAAPAKKATKKKAPAKKATATKKAAAPTSDAMADEPPEGAADAAMKAASTDEPF